MIWVMAENLQGTPNLVLLKFVIYTLYRLERAVIDKRCQTELCPILAGSNVLLKWRVRVDGAPRFLILLGRLPAPEMN